MQISMSLIHSPGLTAGALFVLLISSLTTPSFPQESSWPEPPDVSGLKRQLAESEATKGKDHPDLVEILNKLGDAYRNEGGNVPATPYMVRALSIIEKTHGSEDLAAGLELDKLGNVYLAQGDIARARTSYLRARSILLEKLGQNNPAYGLFLIHLGKLQWLTGQTKEAQGTVDQALTACGKELFKAAHNWTEANRTLGLLFLDLGKYRERSRWWWARTAWRTTSR